MDPVCLPEIRRLGVVAGQGMDGSRYIALPDGEVHHRALDRGEQDSGP